MHYFSFPTNKQFGFALPQVLVKLSAVGVNPVDTYIRSGMYARKPTLPYTPGSDGAGVVQVAGEGVTGFKVSIILFNLCLNCSASYLPPASY